MKEYSYFFKNAADQLGLNLTNQMIEKFHLYSDLLVEWNQKMNLTAIVDPKEIIIKHFIDSLVIFSCLHIKEGSKVIDIGTGAGFPGVPLKIVRPDINLSLLDSLNKRITFLEKLANEIDIDVDLFHMRAEEASIKPEFREQYSIVVSRAVAPLNVLSEYCIPFVKKGGFFAAMKGPSYKEELDNAEIAIKALGGKIFTVENFILPDHSERNVVIIKKLEKTPNNYPRRSTKISKNPL